MDNLELTSSSPRTEKIQEKKRHSERKRQARQETETLKNPSENQRARTENHKQTKVQGKTRGGAGPETKGTPNEFHLKPIKANEALQNTRHRENCKRIVLDSLATVMKKEFAKKTVEERLLSKTVEEHDGEKYTGGKVKSSEKRNEIVYDTMVDIKEKEAATVALDKEKLQRAMAEQEFAEETRDRKEREKSGTMRKDLTDTSASQIQDKKQKKMEREEAERTERQALFESDSLFQTEQREKKRRKPLKACESTSTLGTPTDKRDRQLTDSEEILSKQEELELERLIQDQYSEDEDFEEFEFLQDNFPERFKSRERCTKKVSEQTALIKKREAAEMALLEESLFREMENQQPKKECCETEWKERCSLFELDRLLEIEKQKKMELQKKKEIVYREMEITLAESRQARNRNQSHGGTKGTCPPLVPLKSLQRGDTADAHVKHVEPLPKHVPLLQRRHDLAKRPPSSPDPPIPNRIVLDKKSNAKTKTPLKLPPINSPPRETHMAFLERSKPQSSVLKDSTASEKTTLKLPPINGHPGTNPMPSIKPSRPQSSVLKDSTASEKTTLKLPPIQPRPSRPATCTGRKT